MSNLWVDKYKPTKIIDIVGNKAKIQTILDWIQVFKTRKYTPDFKNGVLISGCPGIGKTSSSKVILEELGYDVFNFDTSTDRTNGNMKARLTSLLDGGNILKFTSTNKVKALILDEIDGIHNSERGSISELISFLECDETYNTKRKSSSKTHINTNPIICICNTLTPPLKKLAKVCMYIQFDKPSDDILFNLLKNIAKCESLNINDTCIQLLVQYAQRDIRRAIYLLETLKINGESKEITCKDIHSLKNFFGSKNIEFGQYQAVTNIYNTVLSPTENLQNYNIDKTFVPLIIHENIIAMIKSNKTLPYKQQLKNVELFYDHLIGSSIIDTKMFNGHNWVLKDYVGMLSCQSANRIIDGKGTVPTLKCSPVISKTNYKFYNLKLINEICRKLDIPINNFQEYTKLFYDIVIFELYTKKERDHLVKTLKQQLTFSNLEKIIKLSYLYTDYQKKYTIKTKRILEKYFLSL